MKRAPEFFTVYLPEMCSHHLKICSSFKTHLGRTLGREAVIKRSATNQEWKVDLVMDAGEFFFNKGWNEFVTQNDITVGEFMVFQYHGKSRFSVDLFGTNCLLKVTPAKDTLIFWDTDEDKEERGFDAVSVVRCTRGRPCESEKGNKAVSAADRFMAKLKKPSFRVCITDSCLNFNTIHLPSEFIKRHMIPGQPGQVEAVDLEISEKTWRVSVWNCRNYKAGKIYYRFGAGFADFIQDNQVDRGDVCVFEAVDLPATTFKVFILRADYHY